MDITLIIDYINKRTTGGPLGVAFDTVGGFKKNHRRLEKEDIHINVMSESGASFYPVFEKDEQFSNITVEYFRQIVPTAIFSDLNYLLHITPGKTKIDLIHSHSIAGAVVGTLHKIPTILTLHGMLWKEKNYVQGIYPKFTFEVNTQRFRYVSSRLKKLVAISPYVIEEVERFLKTRIPENEVIENPISDVFFEQEKRDDGRLILYPGSIDPRKNQITLIKALDILKKDKVKFRCVLPGPVANRHYFNEVMKMIKKFDLGKDVTLPGPVPFEHLLGLYSEASVMVMTTLQETAPMVISEAMATGTPVIAPRISGIPYMVSPGKTGFLTNPDSPEEIAQNIALLLDDRMMRKKFSDESRRIAGSRWRSDVITNKLIDLYLKEGQK